MLHTLDREQSEQLAIAARMLQAGGYHFVTPTPATHRRVNARQGAGWAQDLRGAFGWSRPFSEAVVPPALLQALREAGLVVRQGDGWRSLVRFSSLDGLLFAHSAYPTLGAEAVFFGPDTYRFADAIQGVLWRGLVVRRAVDIGCGAGPGAVLVARARPGAEVLAVDINDAALRLTDVNARVADVSVTTVNSNLLNAVPGQFDLIVSNPPYLVDPSERTYRHGGGPLGAELSLDILASGIERLAPGGTLLLYTGSAIIDGEDLFLAAARERLESAGLAWRYRETDPDVFGEELESGPYVAAERIAAVVLTVQKT